MVFCAFCVISAYGVCLSFTFTVRTSLNLRTTGAAALLQISATCLNLYFCVLPVLPLHFLSAFHFLINSLSNGPQVGQATAAVAIARLLVVQEEKSHLRVIFGMNGYHMQSFKKYMRQAYKTYSSSYLQQQYRCYYGGDIHSRMREKQIDQTGDKAEGMECYTQAWQSSTSKKFKIFDLSAGSFTE